MDILLLFIVLAVTVEALVEYGKNIIEHEDAKTLVLQVAALGIAIALCCLAGADIFAALGVEFGRVPYVGCVLTGIFASRGANWASDLLSRLQSRIGN